MAATGTRAALLGNEAGRLEAWVYPLKLFRDFHLTFLTENRALPAESLARAVQVRPESASILYVGDTFSVRETLVAPVHEEGSLIFLEVETEQPLEIEAEFHRDFALEWPAGLGGTYSYWNAAEHAFYFGEEQRKFAALVGSPTGALDREEYQTNYSESQVNSFRLGVTAKGKDRKLIVIAGSMNGAAEVEGTYKRLSKDADALLADSAKYYRDFLQQGTQLQLPDRELQAAYDWARVDLQQGLVTNPALGTGIVAGYRTSGESQRPGFAWYFGRDSFWTSFALNAAGDFPLSRAALDFIGKYQRDDGKIPHEISQGASLVPWFKDFPYAYASADATPLYIIAVNDYVMKSGDTDFAKLKWSSVRKAYEFLQSTYDEQSLPKNFGVGHGWVEGGPLLPVESEFYQSGLGAEAVEAIANLARLTSNDTLAAEAGKDFLERKQRLNQVFWIAEKNRFGFAMGRDQRVIDEPSVLATVPMWFGLLDENKAGATISAISDFDAQTDWGMRIISANSAKFSGGGYHYGSVWPLFTGWAAVGEYRYHRTEAAYENLRANALLAFDGSLGHVTEVLSGDYYQPLSTSSPQQIWSAAMVVSPVMKGMLGLETNALQRSVTLAPHIPANWSHFGISNLQLGGDVVSLRFERTEQEISLEAERTAGSADGTLEFNPALSLRAKVRGAELDGKAVALHVQANDRDQHVLVHIPLTSGKHHLRIRVAEDFAVSFSSALPPLGSESEGLRILSETWSAAKDQLTLELAGAAGKSYALSVWNPAQIRSIEGGEMEGASDTKIGVTIAPQGAQKYPHQKLTIHFSK
ncbi:MAG TPA: hypothetical protein VJP87_06295 [Candidatus Acidoferrales bacterium]|nr:hypothetical protein [Candidatus Acidoferrales bacterium]